MDIVSDNNIPTPTSTPPQYAFNQAADLPRQMPTFPSMPSQPMYAYPDYHYRQMEAQAGAEKEISLRVRVATLERELKDRERQRAEGEIAILLLAKIAASESRSLTSHVAPANTQSDADAKLRQITKENEVLRAQLSEANHVALKLITRLEESQCRVETKNAPPHSDTSTLIDLLDDKAEPLGKASNAARDPALFDVTTDEEGELSTDAENNWPSLSTSFSEPQELPYISRFVKEKIVEQKAVEQRETPILAKVNMLSCCIASTNIYLKRVLHLTSAHLCNNRHQALWQTPRLPSTPRISVLVTGPFLTLQRTGSGPATVTMALKTSALCVILLVPAPKTSTAQS